MSADNEGEAAGGILLSLGPMTTIGILRMPMAPADEAPGMLEQRKVGRMPPSLLQQQKRPWKIRLYPKLRRRQELGRMVTRLPQLLLQMVNPLPTIMQ